jgi:hypothetical protein
LPDQVSYSAYPQVFLYIRLLVPVGIDLNATLLHPDTTVMLLTFERGSGKITLHFNHLTMIIINFSKIDLSLKRLLNLILMS